jgi:hypothetical protein
VEGGGDDVPAESVPGGEEEAVPPGRASLVSERADPVPSATGPVVDGGGDESPVESVPGVEEEAVPPGRASLVSERADPVPSATGPVVEAGDDDVPSGSDPVDGVRDETVPSSSDPVGAGNHAVAQPAGGCVVAGRVVAALSLSDPGDAGDKVKAGVRVESLPELTWL